MTKVLITGGCGFIGSNLIEYLLSKTNWSISVLDNLRTGRLDYIEDLKDSYNRITFFKGDIVNIDDVNNSIKNCMYVVNLAAQTGVIESTKNLYLDEEINIKGIINVLKASLENNVKKVIQASSSAVLGDQEMPINESKIPNPISPYGVSKLAGEAYCHAFYKCFGLNSIVLRFSNVYGPKSSNKSSVIAKFIKQIIQSEDLEIFGDGTQTRDFIYVKDICHGIYLALISRLEGYNLFQLGTGKETSINMLIKILLELAEKFNLNKPKIKYSKFKEGEILRNYSNISKAKDILGFSCKNELNNEIRKTFKWFLENAIKSKKNVRT